MRTVSQPSVPRFAPLVLVSLLTATAKSPSAAQEAGTSPFARFPAVSPDGETVAFSYQGDIFRVPTEGGPATRLTVHEVYPAALGPRPRSATSAPSPTGCWES